MATKHGHAPPACRLKEICEEWSAERYAKVARSLTRAQRALMMDMAHEADLRLRGADIRTARTLGLLDLAVSLAIIDPLPRGKGELFALTTPGHHVARTFISAPWSASVMRACGLREPPPKAKINVAVDSDGRLVR